LDVRAEIKYVARWPLHILMGKYRIVITIKKSN